MTASLHQPARHALAAGVMRRQLREMGRHLPGVRTAEDVESVHQMRVASRRMRTALALFDRALSTKSARQWQKQIKQVTKSLGAARDLDVQIEFLDQFIADLPAADVDRAQPGLAGLRARLAEQRAAMQPEVSAAMDRLEASGVLREMSRWTRQAALGAQGDPARDPVVRGEAVARIERRLDELVAHAGSLAAPDNSEGQHDMRIAAKRLRYALEAYVGLLPGRFRRDIKRVKILQTLLGDLHDCDVWIELLPQVAGQIAAEALAGAKGRSVAHELAGLEYLLENRRARRDELYHRCLKTWQRDQAADAWGKLRSQLESARWSPPEAARAAPPPSGTPRAADVDRDDAAMTPPDKRAVEFGSQLGPEAAERLRPVYALAEACEYEVEHAHQVTRLALRLFDELAGLHGGDAARRFWLTAAGLLHDIGWIEGGQGHHKVALRYILQSDVLPWDDRDRLIVGSIARYHRKAKPKTSHEHFMALPENDRQDVRLLAALLRLADGLDYTHKSVVRDVHCEIGDQQIVVRCDCPQPANIDLSRAMKKRDLAEAVFGREFIVACRLLGPNPAEPS